MSRSVMRWRQGSRLRPHHLERDAARVLLVGDSIIAATDFAPLFARHIEEAGGKRFEIVEQITTEAMAWKFLLFLADALCVDVDFIFVFLHAAETIAQPSAFRHVRALLSHIDTHAPDGRAPHVVVFRTPTGSSYGEFAPALCRLEERIHLELGASLVEISSPASEMRGDGTHYTDEGMSSLVGAVVELCERLQSVESFDDDTGSKGLDGDAAKLTVIPAETSRSGPSVGICRLQLHPAFQQVGYVLPHESIEVAGEGREVLCLCFIGPYSGVISVDAPAGAHAITLADPWCTISRPYVVTLSRTEDRTQHALRITLTAEVPRVKKYSLSERFDHEPSIDQRATSFEFALADYRYAGPTLFPVVAFCILDD